MSDIIFEKGNYRVYHMDGVYKVMAGQKGKLFKVGSFLDKDKAVAFCKELVKEGTNV